MKKEGKRSRGWKKNPRAEQEAGATSERGDEDFLPNLVTSICLERQRLLQTQKLEEARLCIPITLCSHPFRLSTWGPRAGRHGATASLTLVSR